MCGFAEEVAAGRHALDGLEAELVLVDHDRPQELDHELQHLDVEDELFEGRGEAALLPAGGVVNEVAVPQDRAPQRHLGLVRALGVGGVGCARVRGAIRQPVAARELSARDVGLGVLRRAEGGSARAHVHIGGERAVHDRRTGAHHLREHDAEQRFGVLLRERRRERGGRHRAHERERRDDDRLTVLGHGDQPLGHRLIEAARAVHRDDGDDARARGDLLEVEAARDRHHADAVERAPRTDRACSETRGPSRADSPDRCRDAGSSPAARSARTPDCRADGWR